MASSSVAAERVRPGRDSFSEDAVLALAAFGINNCFARPSGFKLLMSELQGKLPFSNTTVERPRRVASGAMNPSLQLEVQGRPISLDSNPVTVLGSDLGSGLRAKLSEPMTRRPDRQLGSPPAGPPELGRRSSAAEISSQIAQIMQRKKSMWTLIFPNKSIFLALVLVSCADCIPRVQISAPNSPRTGSKPCPDTARMSLNSPDGQCKSILSSKAQKKHLPGYDSEVHDELLRVRGGAPTRKATIHREDTMIALKEYFTNAHLLPITNRNEPLQDSKKRGMLGSIKWTGLLVGIISYSLILLAWPGGELKIKGVPVPAARRCLAIVTLVSILWASEAVPLHITSLMVPLLTVVSGSLPPLGGAAYSPNKAAKEICGEFFSPTILLFLAGFSIGAVLEKQKVKLK